jgi:hypothetical protein
MTAGANLGVVIEGVIRFIVLPFFQTLSCLDSSFLLINSSKSFPPKALFGCWDLIPWWI